MLKQLNCPITVVARSNLQVAMLSFFQAEDGIRDYKVTGVQTCALPICSPLMAHSGSGYRLRWLAPATAALVLLCMIFNHREGGIASGSTNSNSMVAMILSNQDRKSVV